MASRTSLREQIGVSLRAARVAGEMVPGVTYSAPVLAERFGVSATPVREAMLDLINEGYKALKADPYWEELKAKHNIQEFSPEDY